MRGTWSDAFRLLFLRAFACLFRSENRSLRMRATDIIFFQEETPGLNIAEAIAKLVGGISALLGGRWSMVSPRYS